MNTSIGYISLLIWATLASLISLVISIPTFEILAIVFFVSFFFTALKLTLYSEWYKVKQPLLIWCIGTLGVFGNESLFFTAFKYAPPAQVTLIFYLWPLIVFLVSALLLNEKFTYRHILACFIGLTGIYFAIAYGQNIKNFSLHYFKGYFFAFSSACVWSSYTIASKKFKQTPIEMIGLYCGIGSIIALILHSHYEITVNPNIRQFIIIFIMGLTTEGLAYFLWDFGIKNGNYKLLCLLSYGNPLVSILLLILLGLTQPTMILALASLLVISSAVISEFKWSMIKSN